MFHPILGTSAKRQRRTALRLLQSACNRRPRAHVRAACMRAHARDRPGARARAPPAPRATRALGLRATCTRARARPPAPRVARAARRHAARTRAHLPVHTHRARRDAYQVAKFVRLDTWEAPRDNAGPRRGFCGGPAAATSTRRRRAGWPDRRPGCRAGGAPWPMGRPGRARSGTTRASPSGRASPRAAGTRGCARARAGRRENFRA